MHWNVILADSTAAPPATQATSTTQPAAQGAASPVQSGPQQPLFANNYIFLFGLMAVMMYFVLFRPQQQQAKKQAKLLAALKSGDKIITSSGIVGVVITVKDTTVSLRSADAKMEVTKSSVTQILESGEATPSTT
jgi:preprotein translocase subunit YajC